MLHSGRALFFAICLSSDLMPIWVGAQLVIVRVRTWLLAAMMLLVALSMSGALTGFLISGAVAQCCLEMPT